MEIYCGFEHTAAVANEGSVSTVWSAEGKRPEFVSAKRVQTPLQGGCTTIERTDFESRRDHQFSYQIDRFALKKAAVKMVGFFFFTALRNTKNLLTEDDHY